MMNDEWDDDNRDDETKIKRLKRIVVEVANQLDKYSSTLQDKNTMALVPFNYWTKKLTHRKAYCQVTQWQGSPNKTVDSIFEDKDCNSINDKDSSRFLITTEVTLAFSQMVAG